MGKPTGDILLLHDAVQSCETCGINEPDMNSNSVLDTNSTNIKLKRHTIRVAQSCYETNPKCGQIGKKTCSEGGGCSESLQNLLFQVLF